MKTLARASVILALIVSAGICFLSGFDSISTDIYELLGDGKWTALTALARHASSQVRILGDDAHSAQACRAAAPLDEPLDPQALFELVRTHGKGLLGPRARTLLEQGETNKIARSAWRRDYAGVGLFPKADDPYYFLQDFVMDLQSLRPQLTEGQVLLTGTLSPTGDAEAIRRLLEIARTNPKVHLSGSPFHTYLATASSMREINLLGGISLAAVLVLGFLLFRDFRFVLPTVLALGAGFLVASAVVLTGLGGRPHVLTFVFGTTLIGLGVDYCYHARASAETGARPRLLKSLTCALVTTGLAFVPLLFSSLAILVQMALFTLAGLVTVYAVVVLWFGNSR